MFSIALYTSLIVIFFVAFFLDRLLNVIDFRDDCVHQIIKTHNYKRAAETLYFLLPSFKKMLFSFKRLKVENWFTKVEINDLFKIK